MFVCPQCKIENRINAKFCRKCGQPRAELEKSVVTATREVDSDLVVKHGVDEGQDSRSGAMQGDAAWAGERQPQSRLSGTEPRSNALRDSAEPVVTISQGPAVQSDEVAAGDQSAAPECPNCWTVLRSTDKFCCWCGSPQPNRLLPFMKLCVDCNTQLPEKANFCFSCGSDVASHSRLKVRVPTELFKDEDSEFFPRFDA